MELPKPCFIYTQNDIQLFLQHQSHNATTVESILFTNNFEIYIKNLKSGKVIIASSDHIFLATVNTKTYNNTHIASPYTLYIDCTKLAVNDFPQWWIKKLISIFTFSFGKLFKLLDLDKVIQINNTLNTINIHPEQLGKFILFELDQLTHHHPHHAIIIPRLNFITDKVVVDNLKSKKFSFIITKTTHIYDPKNNYMQRSHTKRDISFLKKSKYKIVTHDDLSRVDLQRIHALYQLLFIRKYFSHSPDLTIEYFYDAHQYRWLEFIALRSPEGVIDGFISYTLQAKNMACGPLGYDIEKPRDLGLYRMIISLSLQKAHQLQCVYNLGSKNEAFKLYRGSTRTLEYNAVYYRHLPFYRQIPWKILNWCGNYIMRPIFKRILM